MKDDESEKGHPLIGSSLNFLGEYRRPARLFFPCRLVQHISKIIARLLGGGRARHHAVSCQSEHPTSFNSRRLERSQRCSKY